MTRRALEPPGLRSLPRRAWARRPPAPSTQVGQGQHLLYAYYDGKLGMGDAEYAEAMQRAGDPGPAAREAEAGIEAGQRVLLTTGTLSVPGCTKLWPSG
jgi:hypothetical protein